MKKLRWTDLTEEQQATFGNGCGPQNGFIGCLVPELLFGADCRQHDFYYWRGGGLFDKIEADVMFWAHMIKSVNDTQERWYDKLPFFIASVLYFLAVSTFGCFCWRWGMSQKTEI